MWLEVHGAWLQASKNRKVEARVTAVMHGCMKRITVDCRDWIPIMHAETVMHGRHCTVTGKTEESKNGNAGEVGTSLVLKCLRSE